MICEGQQRLSGLSLIQKVLKMGKPRDIDFEKLQLCGWKAASDFQTQKESAAFYMRNSTVSRANWYEQLHLFSFCFSKIYISNVNQKKKLKRDMGF